ncbi:MAG: 50S ribosomal protein L13 [Candidatus Omnitrophota bacterium]
MKTTYIPKKEDIKRKWYLVDAQDKTLGRMAARIASILRGKHKAMYTPHLDTGDGVIVINAAKVKVTGKKLQQKVYRRYSGYPDGLHEVGMDTMFAKKPETVVKLAVKRMLSQGPLGREMFKKLKVYADDQYPHKAQKPELLEL